MGRLSLQFRSWVNFNFHMGADGHFFCAFFRRLLARDLATVAFARFTVMRRKRGMAVVCHRSNAKARLWKLKLTHYPPNESH